MLNDNSIIRCLYEIEDCTSQADLDSAKALVIDSIHKSCRNSDNAEIAMFWDNQPYGDAYVTFNIEFKYYLSIREQLGEIYITQEINE